MCLHEACVHRCQAILDKAEIDKSAAVVDGTTSAPQAEEPGSTNRDGIAHSVGFLRMLTRLMPQLREKFCQRTNTS